MDTSQKMFKLISEMEKYKSIIDNIKECYFEVDLKGNLIDFNNSLEKLTGYSRDELSGLNYKYLADEKNRKKIFKGFNTVFNTANPLTDFQYEFHTKNGEVIIGETSVYLKLDSKGNKIGFYGLYRDITRRKEEEKRLRGELENIVRLRTKELRESEAKFRDVIFNLDLGFYQVKWDGKILNHNPAFCKILGYRASDNLIGTSVHNFWQNPKEREQYLKEMEEKGFVKNYIVHSQDKNEKKMVIQLNSHIIEREMNKPIIIEGLISDVTEKFELEQKLKESEERYRNLFESMPFSIVLVDQKGMIVYCNPATKRLTGYEINDLIGKQFSNLSIIHPNYLPILLKRFNRSMKGEYSAPLDVQVYDKDGGLRWINYQSLLVTLGNEKLLQIIINDITEQKKAEEDLIESENKFRTIFEAIPDLYFLVTDDTTILDYRGKEEDLYLTPDQFLGKKLSDILPLSINKLLEETIKETIKTQKPRIMEYSLPIKGQIRYFESRHLFFSKERVAIFIREITERKKADFLIKEEIKKLKELDQIRRDLISRVSHELKTPLVSVCGGSELVLNLFKDKLDSNILELIELIEKGGKRLKYLVDNLMDITRIEYHKFKLDKKLNNLGDIIKECSEELSYLIKERKLNLSIDVPDNVFIELDKIRIEQVIINLLSNAIKNTPPNGLVKVILKEEDDWVKISIVDNGIGLTKEEMDKIFTRFGKIERYGEGLEYIDIQGSGLGLYISKEIIDLHDGQIRAESEGRNKGSTFIVKLPINKR